MFKQTCASTYWQKITKRGCLTLASALLVSACGGGYNGGESFEQPNPTATPAPVEVPVPTAAPTPEPIVKTDPAKVEYLDRGLVVFPVTKGNAVSWRLLGTDSSLIAFDVYRNGSKLNESPLTHTTFFSDEDGQPGDSYQVLGMVGDTEVGASAAVQPWAAAYHTIDLNRPKDGRIGDEKYTYDANDASAADLDGDGQYEIILKWMPVDTAEGQVNGGSRDNSQSGITGNVFIDAYTLEGTQLWRIDLGKNVRAGAHYNPFVVYDFDGDGRAELAIKTADGTVDGRGVVIGDSEAEYRNDSGYIIEGPEFLTMFDGLSAEALDTIDFSPERGVVSAWGDSYGNRVDRMMAAVASFGEGNPSLVMTRGVYTRVVVAAFDWVDGAFVDRWVFDSDIAVEGANGQFSSDMYGQGNHNLTVGDVDGDGKDEIVYGSGAIDDDGRILYATGLCDGDAIHMGDFNPARAGLEVFSPHESEDCYGENGVEMHDAATGEILWGVPGVTGDVGRGISADIDPRFIGNESWASRGNLTAADGADLGGDMPSTINFAIWWEGDLLRELLDGTSISKWNYLGAEDYTMLNAGDDGASSNNGTKANPSLQADLFGDWREEVVWSDSIDSKLMIYSTPHSASTRMHTLMHDDQYRKAVAWQNVGYNQPPHPSFYVGPGMDLRWEANVTAIEGGEWAKFVAQGNADDVEVRLHTNGFDVGGIEIFRDSDADPEGRVSIANLTSEALTGDALVYVDTDVVPDVDYYYWAELSSTVGDEVHTSKTRLTSTLLPYNWVGAVQSQAFNEGPVKLVWETENIDISEIKIYRVDALAADDIPNESAKTLVGSVDASAEFWIDESSVVEGAAYFYWVEFSDATAAATYLSDARFGVHVPESIRTTEAEFVNNTIEITWEVGNFAQDIISVELYRNTSDSDGGRVRILSSAPVSGSYVDNTPRRSAGDWGPALPGVNYWYTLKVTLQGGAKPVMPRVHAFIPPDEGLPMVGAWAEVKSTEPLQMQVSWEISSVDVASVEIFRGTNPDGSERESMGTVDAAETSWVDAAPAADTTYYYWVEVTDADSEIQPSQVTNSVSLPPETNLETSLVANGINVSWDLKHFPSEITSVELYRNTIDAIGGRSRIAVGLLASGSIVDDGSVEALVDGQSYWYMFKINRGEKNTDPEAMIVYDVAALPSAEPTAEPTAEPQMTNLTSTLNGDAIDLSWDLQGYVIDGAVDVYRNDKDSTDKRVRVAVGVDATGTFTDDGSVEPLFKGVDYWYMFKISNPGDAVSTVPEAQITYGTPPAAGENLTTSVKSTPDGDVIEVRWNLQGFAPALTNGTIELYRYQSGVSGRKRISRGVKPWGTFEDNGDDTEATGDLVLGDTYHYQFKFKADDSNSAEVGHIVFSATP